MYKDVEKILISEEEIAKKVSDLAEQITKEYEGKNLVLICILKGSAVFTVDLMKKINLPLEVEFMGVSSYGNATVTTGEVKISIPLNKSFKGKHIMLVEDIIDTGVTLKFLKEHFESSDAESVKICTLLSKPGRRINRIEADYTGFVIPDEFIVGYGLDYGDLYRNLPFVGTLKRSVYENKDKK